MGYNTKGKLICDICRRRFHDGEIIQIKKSAVVSESETDYMPDGENFIVCCEGC